MAEMHSLLKRQLRRYFGDSFSIPKEWQSFVDAVDNAYQEFDADRNMLEHSLELSSEELLQANSEMRAVIQLFPDLFLWLDMDGTIVDFKAGSETDLYLTQPNLIGKRIQNVPQGYVGDKFQQAIHQIQQTGSNVSIDYSLVMGGQEHFYEARLLPLLEKRIFVIIRNITERKSAENKLQSAFEELNKASAYREGLLGSMTDGLGVLDLNGNVIDVNASLLEKTGLKKEQLLGLPITQVLTPMVEPEELEKVILAMQQLINGNPVEPIEMVATIKDDTRITISLAPSVVRDDKGNPMTIFATMRNITERKKAEEALRKARDELEIRVKERTAGLAKVNEELQIEVAERKQAEEALRESEERLRAIFEGAQDAIFTKDRKGHYTHMNTACASLFGLAPDEAIGKTDFDLFPLKTASHIRDEVDRKVLEKGKVVSLEDTKPTAGVMRTFDVIKIPLRDENGEIVGLCGISRDITERKKAEDALRQSEERYRAIIDSVEEAYFEVDIAGNITFVSDAASRTSGYSKEEMTGMNYRNYSSEKDFDAVYEAFNQVYQTGKPIKDFSWEASRRDGTRRFLETSASPIWSQEGEITGFRGVMHDITERKRIEAERKELEQKAQLASRLASIGEMASGIAHEINNPLTGVIGYAQLLMQKDVPEDIKKELEIINDGAKRVASIIRRMLTFARQYKPEQTQVNINDILANTLALRAYELETSNIKVATKLDPDLPITIADGGQLQQVFLNLIVNAEIEMKSAHDRGKLSIKTETVNSTIRISFKDTGPGITRENLEKIFDPFFTTREVGQGTGLGLSVCHGIITEHHGNIYATSKPGKGATFTVELPVLSRLEQSVLVEPDTEEYLRVAKSKILVIDDESVVRDFISQVLTNEGHKVEAIDNAEDALKMIRDKRYSLILLDIKMPGMSGIELYNHLQQNSRSLISKIIFITGDVIGTDTLDFLSKSKAPYITKPIDAEQLKRSISHLLAKST